MKLTYRGISYDYNPPQVEASETGFSGKYRGLDIRFRNPKKPLILSTNLDLLYRGVAYKTGESAPVAPAPVPAAAPATAHTPSIQERARVLMMGHHRAVKRRQQSMLARLDARVGVPSAEATRYWNHIQGKVHPSFGDSYDRSGAALS